MLKQGADVVAAADGSGLVARWLQRSIVLELLELADGARADTGDGARRHGLRAVRIVTIDLPHENFTPHASLLRRGERRLQLYDYTEQQIHKHAIDEAQR